MQKDEMSLYDIVNVLRSHKWLYWISFFIILTIGITAIWVRPVQYQYLQSIKLASYLDDNSRIVLLTGFGNKKDDDKDSSAQAFTKVSVDLLSVAHVYQKNHTSADATSEIINGIEISQNKGNGVITLSAKGNASKKSFYEEIFQVILQQLIDNTSSFYANAKNNLTIRLGVLENERALQRRLIDALEMNDAGAALAAKVDVENAKNVFPVRSDNRDNKLDMVLKFILVQQLMEKDRNLANELFATQTALNTLDKTHFSSEMIGYKSASTSRKNLLILLTFLSLFGAFVVVFGAEFLKSLPNLEPNN